MAMNLSFKLPPLTNAIKPQDPITNANKNTLESIESQRILSMVDNCITNCQFIALFDSIINDLESFSYLLGTKLYMLFLRFTPIYKAYLEVSNKLLYIKNPGYLICLETELPEEEEKMIIPENFWTTPIQNLKVKPKPEVKKISEFFTPDEIDEFKDKLPELEEKLKDMTPLVHYFVRSIIIAFNKNNEGVESILNNRDIWFIRRKISLVKFIDHMKDLREMVRKRLQTSPIERDNKARILTSIKFKEIKYVKLMKNLRINIDKLKMDKEKLIYQMNDDVIKLQKGIYALEIKAVNDAQKIEKRAEKEINYNAKLHEENKIKLQTEINDLKKQYKELVEKNRETELAMRRKKWKLENICENWIDKYDEEMTQQQQEYDKLKSEFDEDVRLYEDLQQRFEPLEKQYLQVLEDQKLRKEVEDKEKAEKEALIYWATVIQSFWRAWNARKAFRKNRRRRR